MIFETGLTVIRYSKLHVHYALGNQSIIKLLEWERGTTMWTKLCKCIHPCTSMYPYLGHVACVCSNRILTSIQTRVQSAPYLSRTFTTSLCPFLLAI